jgi:hypothetical protein
MITHSSSNFKIVNIVKDRSIDELWFTTLEQISLGSDKLRNNYKEIDLSMFISFYAAVEENKILGFSGLQYMPDRWGTSIARCMSRFYLRPDFRHGHSIFHKPALITEQVLPMQIRDSQDFGIDSVFMSREKGRCSFEKLIEFLKIKNKSIDFNLLNDRYNVCGCLEPIPESCKQYIALMHLTDRGAETWNRDMLQHRVIQVF